MSYGLKQDEKYSAPIDRISGSGNGIIEIGDVGHVNLGTMPESRVGKLVTFVYNRGHDADFLQIGEQKDATPIEDVNLIDKNSQRSSGMNGRSKRSTRLKSRNNPVSNEGRNRNHLLSGNQ